MKWDVVVVGAGPAGALAAGELARAGQKVLLVDQARFPRDKVCGACLLAPALHALAAAGLAGLVEEHGGVALDRLVLHAAGRTAALDIPGGRALSRRTLDQALVEAAIARGARFRDGTRARRGAAGEVVLNDRESVGAGVVLAADGLAGSFLGVRRRVAPRSLLGAGAVIGHAPAALAPGAVHMTCGRGGYVGLVRVEGDRLMAAAALAPALVRSRGGPAGAARVILAGAGLPPLPEAAWRGTPRLTGRPARAWADGILALGDAAGFVEPFTGEGIGWALRAARAVVPLALEGWHPGLGPRWERTLRRLPGARQLRCRALAAALRHPWAARAAVRLLARAPLLARPLFAATVGAAP